MGKRNREAVDGDDTPRKAPKRVPRPDFAPPADITSIQAFRQQIYFRQDDTEALRSGQWAVKSFLDSISSTDEKDQASKLTKLAILKEYLDAEPTDLTQAWSYAAQTDNDRLAIAVTSNIALLLRTLSHLLNLRDHGLAFGRSLLQREQLKSLSRGLTAASHKEAMISPCLRILTELVSFDGGALAGQVFRHQDLIFNTKFLDRNLRLGKGGEEDRRQSSVRSNTIRYILAQIRHQDIENRLRIVDMRSIFRNMLENIRSDPAWLIQETIKTMESSILRSPDVPRRHKSAIISDRVLVSVTDALRGHADAGVQQVGWSFLQNICSDVNLGIMLPSSWYPATNERHDEDYISGANDVPLDFTSIRNSILSKFLQHLKPHVNLKERELLCLACRSCPELVADYMRKSMDRLPMQPKLTNTWVGYSSLLFSLTSLPIPEYLGSSNGFRSEPPPVANILENIVPAPLTKEVVRKCLAQPSNLITFFATSLIVLALSKLKEVLSAFTEAEKTHEVYEDARSNLCNSVATRLPLFKDICDSYRTISESDTMSKEASAHAISLYLDVLPDHTQHSVFDAAGQLTLVVSSIESAQATENSIELNSSRLTHMLNIAENSQGMRWWQRQTGMQFSPFLTLMKMLAMKDNALHGNNQIKDLVAAAAYNAGILQSHTDRSSADALLASLESQSATGADADTWIFLDECISRLTKKPVKYLDDLDTLGATVNVVNPAISLLLLVVAEQIPFKVSAGDKSPLLDWASCFASALVTAGEDVAIVKQIKKELKAKGLSLHTTVKTRQIVSRLELASPEEAPDNPPQSKTASATKRQGIVLEFTSPASESDKHPELVRYKKQDLDELIGSGTMAKLFLCLCSEYPEIRKQGMTALGDLLDSIKNSNADYKDQLWLLVGELIETSRSLVGEHERPLSYIAGAFATASIKVLLDPTHLMFPLVNRFLVKDPYWNVKKLPGWFLDKTLLSAPEGEDDFWSRVEWVLEFLVDGIRKAEDVRDVRFRNGLERILAITSSPRVTTKAHGMILQLVHRIASVEGSTSLVLNAGINAWLAQDVHRARFAEESLQELKEVIESRADTGRVATWRGQGGET